MRYPDLEGGYLENFNKSEFFKIISEHNETKCDPVTDIYHVANRNVRKGSF